MYDCCSYCAICACYGNNKTGSTKKLLLDIEVGGEEPIELTRNIFWWSLTNAGLAV